MVISTFVLPIVVMLTLCIAVGVYVKIKYPSPLMFPCVVNNLCPVVYEQIVDDIDQIKGVQRPRGMRLRREAVWKEFRLNWLYLCEEANNTLLFLRALRF